MAGEIRVPPLGESIFEATVGRWLRAAGEPVARGEIVVELDTDKVNLAVEAETEGVLQEINHQAGDVVGIGDVLGVIGTTDGAKTATVPLPAGPAADQPASGAAPATAPANLPTAATPNPYPSTLPDTPQTAAPTDATPAPAADAVPADAEAGRVTPIARRLAEEHGIDLASLADNAHGRVTREDVLDQVERRREPATPSVPAAPPPDVPPAAAPTPPTRGAASAAPTAVAPAVNERETRQRMTRRRQTIARRLVEAQRTAAMLTTFNEVDMSAVMAVRARRRDAFKERHGVGLGFMSFFSKAVVGGLKAFPRLNAEIEGDEMVLKHYYDIGIAVGAEEGLVVPVVRDADRKSFAQIEKEIGDLAGKARSNTLSLADLQGGTFTITNGGIFGSLLSTPILNAPQVGILGMHKIEERPIALKGEVVVRPMMYLALSYDHRIVDGREAVQFLVRVKELLEDPEALLLEG